MNKKLRLVMAILGLIVALGVCGYGVVMPGKEIPAISLAAELIPIYLPIPGFEHGIPNTLPTSVLTSLILIILGLFYSRAVRRAEKTGVESRFLIAVDAMFEAVYRFFEHIAGKAFSPEVFPLIASFFLFILVANWLGLIPGIGSIGIEGELHGEKNLIPLLRAPNADLNTTLGLAIISLVATQYVGFKHLGLKYLKKFFNFSAPPGTKGVVRLVLVVANGFAGLLELVAELIKIFSFAFRLFGNAFAGEVLLMVISFLASFIIVIPFLGLELFVGLIQALIFAMLSLIFFRMAIHHHL